MLSRMLARFRRYPDQADVAAVSAMTAAQWRGIAKRTPTYLEGYRDRPGSQDRAQRRAEWIAALPVFAEARSVFEIGCGCGRNLAAIRRRYHEMTAGGCDVSVEALSTAHVALPGCMFFFLDLATFPVWPMLVHAPLADVALSVGVLVHLHPSVVEHVVPQLLACASRALVLVEEEGHGEVAKGPRQWGAEKVTGEYILWRHPITDILLRCGVTDERALPLSLPEDLQAPGATKVWVVRT